MPSLDSTDSPNSLAAEPSRRPRGRKRWRAVLKESLSPEELAAAEARSPGFTLGEIDVDYLAGQLMGPMGYRSRTAMRRWLEEELARTMERAMRGERTSFLDIFDWVPGELRDDGVYNPDREPGALWDKLMGRFVWVQRELLDLTPRLLKLHDERTGTVNELLTRGGRVLISGQDMEFRPNDTDEGFFLVGVRGENDASSGDADGPLYVDQDGTIIANERPGDGGEASRGGGDASRGRDEPSRGGQALPAGGEAPTRGVEERACNVEDQPAGREFRLIGGYDQLDYHINGVLMVYAEIPRDLPDGVYRLECRSRRNGGMKIGALKDLLRP